MQTSTAFVSRVHNKIEVSCHQLGPNVQIPIHFIGLGKNINYSCFRSSCSTSHFFFQRFAETRRHYLITKKKNIILMCYLLCENKSLFHLFHISCENIIPMPGWGHTTDTESSMNNHVDENCITIVSI
jgi:hypothetical protein